MTPTAPRDRARIDYGPAIPPYRRAWAQRVAVFVVVLAAAAALGGWVFMRVPAALAWRRAMQYTEPADLVIFDNDPVEAARLLRTGHYDEVAANYKDRPGLNGAARMFSLGGEFDCVDGALFLHQRRVPSHKQFRLVGVYGAAAIERTPTTCFMRIGAVCYPPQGVAIPQYALSPTPKAIFIPPGGRLRIFAGQPDAADDSHFTIKYELNGIPGLIEGWLRDESYEGVELRITSGPAAPKR